MIEPSCSFCAKSRDKALVLVAGPAVYICDECIDLAFDIVAEKREHAQLPWVIRFDQALDRLECSRGVGPSVQEFQALLDEPGADERLVEAGKAARRMIGELREIRQAVRAALKAERSKDEQRTDPQG